MWIVIAFVVIGVVLYALTGSLVPGFVFLGLAALSFVAQVVGSRNHDR